MKIKLFYVPELCGSEKPGYPKEPARFPLISIPIIKSFAESYGFKVAQDDLDIKVFHDNKKSKSEKISVSENKFVNMELFDDRKRIAKYLKTGKDEELEEHASRILKKTQYKGFDMLGFSFVHCWTFAPTGVAMVMSKMMKEETDSLMVLGGPRFEEKIAGVPLTNIPFIDFFCFRTNHYEFTRLLNYINSGKIEKKELLPSTIYNEKRIKRYLDVRKTHSAKLKDLPNAYHIKEVLFPVPNFEGLPLELYKFIPKDVKEQGLAKDKMLILPYFFIHGCPNNCIFCKDSQTNIFFAKSPENVAEELGMLSKKYKTTKFIFTNTSVNPSKKYAEHLADEIIKKDLGLHLFDCATFKQMDKNLLTKLQKAGARRLLYGLECASPRMQKYLEKNIDLKEAAEILKLGNKLNIWNEVEIISGLPHETAKDRRLSLSFLKKNKKFIDYFYLTKFYLTDSKLTQNPKKYGLLNIREKKDDTCEGLAYDEINGLKWGQKVLQLNSAFKEYENFRNKVINPNFDNSNIHFYKVFYLYSVFDKKEDIKDYINKHGVEID